MIVLFIFEHTSNNKTLKKKSCDKVEKPASAGFDLTLSTCLPYTLQFYYSTTHQYKMLDCIGCWSLKIFIKVVLFNLK